MIHCVAFVFILKIINYSNAFENTGSVLASVPYQVSIQLHNKHRCSGAIITNRYVLTTTSCIINAPRPHKPLFIGVGSTKWHKCELYPADLVIRHKDFSNKRPKKKYNNRENVTKPYEKPNPLFLPLDEISNDVALIHLRYNMTFSKNVTPVLLSTNFKKKEQQKIMMLTWRISKMHRDLRAVELQQFNKTCFGSTMKLCFKAVDGGYGRYDYGAPIVHNKQLIAVHSKTVVTPDNGVVTVGTLVPHYYDWILDKMYDHLTHTDVLNYFGKAAMYSDIETENNKREEERTAAPKIFPVAKMYHVPPYAKPVDKGYWFGKYFGR